MFTSRAEYRILLRFSNAHARLFALSKEAGLLSSVRKTTIESSLRRLDGVLSALSGSVLPEDINPTLLSLGERPVQQKTALKAVLKRPRVFIDSLPVPALTAACEPHKAKEVAIEAEAVVKYEGYIVRQKGLVARM